MKWLVGVVVVVLGGCCCCESAEDGSWLGLEDGIPVWAEVKGFVQEREFGELQELMEKKNFAVFREGPAKAWPALEKWKDHVYFGNAVGSHLPVTISDSPIDLTLKDHKELGKTKFEPEEQQYFDMSIHPQRVMNMTLKQIIQGLHRQQQIGRQYHHVNVPFVEDLFGDEVVNKDVPNKWNLQLNDTHVIGSDTLTAKWRIWMAKRGSAQGTRYELSHNLAVQVTGKRRYLVMDVEEWSKVAMFPYLHPHAQQSQYEVEHLARSYKNLDKHVKAFIADLSPGDMLYIPPHCFYRSLPVEEAHSDEIAITLNSLTVSADALFMTYLTKVPLPKSFDKTNDPLDVALAFRFFVTESIVRMNAVHHKKAVKFMMDVFMDRYHGPIAQSLRCSDTTFDSSLCSEENAVVPKAMHNDVGKSINLLKDAFKQGIKVSKIHDNVVPMMLADYIEVVAEYVFGYPLACTHLRCIAFLEQHACHAEY